MIGTVAQLAEAERGNLAGDCPSWTVPFVSPRVRAERGQSTKDSPQCLRPPIGRSRAAFLLALRWPMTALNRGSR